MALADAKRIIRQLQHGETIFTVADDFGITPADVVAILRDPTNGPSLPASGGSVDLGLLLGAKHLENNYVVHPATFTFSQAQNFGPPIELQADHIYDVLAFAVGNGAPGRPFYEIWATGVPDVICEHQINWDGDPADENAPFPFLGDMDQPGQPEVNYGRMGRDSGYVKTGGSLQFKVRITDGAGQVGGTDGPAAGDLTFTRLLVVVRDLTL